MSSRWVVTVNNGRAHDRALHRFGLQPSRNDASIYIGFYSQQKQLIELIDQLKALGLHGKARRIKPTKQLARRAARAAPDAEILRLEIAKENRLAHDALKLARDRRRQAEIIADREVNEQARRALRRASGES